MELMGRGLLGEERVAVCSGMQRERRAVGREAELSDYALLIRPTFKASYEAF